MLSLRTPGEVRADLLKRFRSRRLQMNLTQCELAQRSGVSLGSLKRFEHDGLISFGSLLKLALVLECLDDFDAIAIKKKLVNSSPSLLQMVRKDAERHRARGRTHSP